MADFDALTEIETHSAGLAQAAAGRLDRPVRHCPGWTVADLVHHVGEVQWFWERIVRERPSEAPQFDDRPDRPPDAELVTVLRERTARLVATLRVTDPSTPCWTWAPLQQDVAFVLRHQAQEAAVHRWDAADAGGETFAIPAVAAADAVEEFLTFSVASDADPAPDERPGMDGSFVLAASDLDLAWRLSDGAAPATVRFERVTDGGSAIHASASDLLLWLYGRVEVPVPADVAGIVERFRGLRFTD